MAPTRDRMNRPGAATAPVRDTRPASDRDGGASSRVASRSATVRLRDFLEIQIGGDDVADDGISRQLILDADLGEAEASSVDRRNAVARGMPVRDASSLSDNRRSANEKVLSSSSAFAAASTV
jgi:hypothetical protein